MSKPFYNVTTPVEGNDGVTRFPRVGVAFPTGEESKAIMTIELHATPVNGKLVIFPPKERDGGEE
ncbi:hypothetical protein [uncultured Tateyamaria sp.]|uniref:hypothetical protein n=1 Tax=uncultured Tateyamaria sp. TaxID=455651 RepID=UPI00260DCD64|nr:hypothetical protein [uncultured Tateyamaria sp.]